MDGVPNDAPGNWCCWQLRTRRTAYPGATGAVGASDRGGAIKSATGGPLDPKSRKTLESVPMTQEFVEDGQKLHTGSQKRVRNGFRGASGAQKL